jgi:hypothetical protein
LENPLAKLVIAGKIKEGDTVSAGRPDKGGEGLVFRASKKTGEG